jgi:hypothetical protein
MGFQQLDPMRFSPYMQDCLRHLDEEREVASDGTLVQLVRIQLLSEKITLLDGRYDADSESENIPKAPISGYIIALQAELDVLRKSMPRSLRNNSM